MTAQQVVDAVLVALNTALPGSVAAYDVDEVPTPRPSEYVDIGLTRRFGGNLKQGGSMDVTGYRLTVQAVSRTSVANVRNSLEKCRAAIEFQSLIVGTSTTTPIQFETEDDYDLGSGWVSGVIAFTFAL